jgi:hypothetical protein
MRLSIYSAVLLLLTATPAFAANKQEHQWSIGKILDENRARYFAGILHDSSSSTTNNGTWSGTANSNTIDDTTDTQLNGDYSGTSTTSTSGFDRPVYRVYDNLVVEGDDAVYFTSERLIWRWSKGVHVSVNETVKYYVEGRKLHLLDDDGKEHSIEIIKTVLKSAPVVNTAASTLPENQTPTAVPAAVGTSGEASVTIDSMPAGADIEVDGAFVGDTPSTVTIASGSHKISVMKKGYVDWNRTMNVTSGTIHLNADMETVTAQP